MCETLYEALVQGQSDLDRFWIAEADGKMVGTIAILARGEGVCQLRWLLVAPEYRGCGLGKKLFHEAMAYAESRQFKRIFLETTREQEKAIRLYQEAGFEEWKTYEITGWGKTLTGLTMEKVL